MKCQAKTSVSKRKTKGCKGCRYYRKVFWEKYGNGDVPTKGMMYMKIHKVIVDKKPNNCIVCPLIRLNLCGKEVVVKPDSSGAYVDKVPDKRCLLRTR